MRVLINLLLVVMAIAASSRVVMASTAPGPAKLAQLADPDTVKTEISHARHLRKREAEDSGDLNTEERGAISDLARR
ncbi:unnamed protein product [Phytophthora lilii]|uniref:RxLR effector protein n=1 Tax=Phytophthora lilii TaxID=2077276 RepID=A0A9W6TCT9_9STRA|nr:unnamed protein product [Phytophthora lilii]